MKLKLFVSVITRTIFGLLAVIALVFLPVGTFNYVRGILFTSLLFVPMLVTGIILFFKCPSLLEMRLRLKEKQDTQRAVVLLSAVMFVLGFVLSGLCVRFSFLVVPFWVSLVFSAVFSAGYILYGVVLFQNRYLSRTVEVFEGQKVIDKGLYSFVRHPMYLSTLLMFMSVPMILGSVLGFLVFLIYPAIIVARIKDEEKLLEKELCGYSEYMKKVKYRLIPYIF